MTVGKGGRIGGEGRGNRGGGWNWEGEGRLGPVGRAIGFQIFFKPGPIQPVDWSTGLKDGPDSGLRPNFFGPDGPARPGPLETPT